MANLAMDTVLRRNVLVDHNAVVNIRARRCVWMPLVADISRGSWSALLSLGLQIKQKAKNICHSLDHTHTQTFMTCPIFYLFYFALPARLQS